jgi:hypothetical protein
MARIRPRVFEQGGRTPTEQEDRVARVVRGHRQRGSGASMYAKGDVSSDHFLIECVVPETPILVGHGEFVCAGEVTEGQLVIGGDGEHHAVDYVFVRHYNGPLIDVSLNYSDAVISFTPDHPVLVFCPHCKRTSFVSAEHIVAGDYVLRPALKKVLQCEQYVKIPEKKLSKKFRGGTIRIDNDFARFLGYYAAEGWVRMSKIFMCFSIREKDTFVHDVIGLFRTLFSLDAHTRETTWNSIEIRVGSSVLADYLLKEIGTGSQKIRIPSFVFRSDTSIIESFIQGLYRGDGYRDDEKVSLTTHSYSLAYGTQDILLQLGIASSISETTKNGYQVRSFGVNGRKLRNIVWGEDQEFENVRCPRPLSYVENGVLFSRIKSISSREYSGDVINFQVNGDERYVCGNAIVHNCKRTEHASLSLKKSWLDKISREAAAASKEPALAIEIAGGPDDAHGEREWIMIPLRCWKKLVGITE